MGWMDKLGRFIPPPVTIPEPRQCALMDPHVIYGRLMKTKDGHNRLPGDTVWYVSNAAWPMTLGEYVVSVGRANDCTIVLADPNVSLHEEGT